jgi:hypothetical protein
MKKLLVILLLLASAAHGEIYTWTDSRGTAHYVNSLYDVPDRYRATVKTLDIGEPKKDTGAPTQPVQVQPAQVAPSQGSGSQSPPAARPENMRPKSPERRREIREQRHNTVRPPED